MTDRGPVTLGTVELALFEWRYVDLTPGTPNHPWHPEYAKQPVKCSNTAGCHPTLWAVQMHHHPALAWRRELLNADPKTDTSWWTLEPLCGTDHDQTHALLNMYVRNDGPPSWDIRRTFGTYVRAKVEEAWAKRPPVTPYT